MGRKIGIGDKIMMIKNVDEFVKPIIEVAKKIVENEQQEHKPMFIVPDSNKRLNLMQVMWENDHQKEISAHLIQSALRKFQSEFYVFVNEVWVVMLKSKKKLKEYGKNYIQPSKHPDRKEMLMILFVNREGFVKEWLYPIKKNKEGKRYLGKPHINDNKEKENVVGRFIFKW